MFGHDVAGWRRDRVPEKPVDWPMRMRPDWVCEIVSPKHESNDLVVKPRVLHAAEVPHFWMRMVVVAFVACLGARAAHADQTAPWAVGVMAGCDPKELDRGLEDSARLENHIAIGVITTGGLEDSARLANHIAIGVITTGAALAITGGVMLAMKPRVAESPSIPTSRP